MDERSMGGGQGICILIQMSPVDCMAGQNQTRIGPEALLSSPRSPSAPPALLQLQPNICLQQLLTFGPSGAPPQAA